MPSGYPIPGSLQPISYQFKHTADTTADIMDVLVTSYIKKGVVIGFRFFPQADGYASQFSSNVTFCLNYAVYPGMYLRLTDNGATLVALQTDGTPPIVYGAATTAPFVRDYASCLIFWTPCLNQVEGISFIGFRTPTSDPIPPPTCILACQFSAIVTLSKDDVDGTLRLVAYQGARRGIPAQWVNAWQLLKYGGSNQWLAIADAAYSNVTENLRDTIFVALSPGQLFPIAYRPYNTINYAFAGQLALVVTERIPPGAYVWIVPNCAEESTARSGPSWKWTAPCDCPIRAGMVLDLTGLSMNAIPKANIGTLEAQGSWPTTDFDIYSFTVYAYSVNASTDDIIYPVTGVYSCDHDCQLPLGLTPGQNTPLLPWPSCASILPVDKCSIRPVRSWGAQRELLASLYPIRWLCQPLPSFRTASPCPEPPNGNCCVLAPSCIGVGC